MPLRPILVGSIVLGVEFLLIHLLFPSIVKDVWKCVCVCEKKGEISFLSLSVDASFFIFIFFKGETGRGKNVKL